MNSRSRTEPSLSCIPRTKRPWRRIIGLTVVAWGALIMCFDLPAAARADTPHTHNMQGNAMIDSAALP